MDNLEQQLRRHFESQQLPAARVQEILAAGRAAAAAKRRRVFWQAAAAALVMLALGLWGAGGYFRGQAGPPVIATKAVADAVADYFSTPDYQLSQVSPDRRVLVDWLREHGGPDVFEVPTAMAGLSSYGCQVLDVQGQKVFLICFLLDPPAPGIPAGTMPEKKMMITTSPDGQMMKKTLPLVHLVVAARGQFSTLPKPGERIVLPGKADWHFATWTLGDQVYIAAGALSADKLASLAGVL